MMKLKFQHIFFVALVITLFSCVEEYQPDLGDNYERLLVVEGEINQGYNNISVALSYSTKANRPVYIPASQFGVMVKDDLGNEVELTHTGNGLFRSVFDNFEAFPGRKYKLVLQSYENNRQYESDWETMPQPVAIDSVYSAIEFREQQNIDHTLQGFQFYLNTGIFNNDSTYFRWKLTETFKYYSNYSMKYIFDGSLNLASDQDSLYICYKTQRINEFFARGTVDLSQNQLSAFPLHYVNTETKRLMSRYSLLVEQKVISKKAFKFWNDLSNINSGEISLFTAQPFQVRGNIQNVNDEDEPVLGFFEVSASSEKRIFVDRPSSLDFYYPQTCGLLTEELFTLFYSYVSSWPLYLTVQYTDDGPVMALPTDQSCIDCTQKGGELEPPNFWIE